MYKSSATLTSRQLSEQKNLPGKQSNEICIGKSKLPKIAFVPEVSICQFWVINKNSVKNFIQSN